MAFFRHFLFAFFRLFCYTFPHTLCVQFDLTVATQCNSSAVFASYYMKNPFKNPFQEKILLYKIQTRKDADSFAILYDLYVEPIYRFVFFKISHRQEAEDVTSDIFLKCWQYLVSEKGGEVLRFSSLIYTIARHCIVDVYRERSKRNECAIQESNGLSDLRSQADLLEQNQDAKQLLAIVNTLKHEYREIITLKYIEEFSIGEIAALLGKNQTNVRVTLHRALKKLQELSRGTALI